MTIIPEFFMQMLRREPVLALLVGIFLALGVWQSTYHYGFPTVVGDEPPPMVAALKMIGEGMIRPAFPTFYYMPVSAYAAIPFAALGLAYHGVVDGFTSLDEVRRFVVVDFAELLPFARVGSVIFGVIDILLWYQIVYMIFEQRRRALLAAYLLAASLLFFQITHFGKVWSLHIAFIMMSLLYTTKIWKGEQTMRNYLLASLGAILAFGVNIIGSVVWSALLFVHLLVADGGIVRRLFSRKIVAAFSLFLIGISLMSLINPYGFGNNWRYVENFFGIFARGVSAQASVPNYSDPVVSRTWDWGYYPKIMLEYDPILVLFSVLGLYAILRRERALLLWMSGWTLVYYVGVTMISGAKDVLYEPRYALPIYLLATLLGAVSLSNIATSIEQRSRFAAKSVLVAFVVVYALVPLLWAERIERVGTRELALQWVKEMIPSGSRIMVFDDYLPVPENTEGISFVQRSTPQFMTVRRSWMLEHPEDIPVPSYVVYHPNYMRDGKLSDLSGTRVEYVIHGYFDPAVYRAEKERIQELFPDAQMSEVARFPATAGDDRESLDLPNNMRSPFFRLWGNDYNGPVVVIDKVTYGEH